MLQQVCSSKHVPEGAIKYHIFQYSIKKLSIAKTLLMGAKISPKLSCRYCNCLIQQFIFIPAAFENLPWYLASFSFFHPLFILTINLKRTNLSYKISDLYIYTLLYTHCFMQTIPSKTIFKNNSSSLEFGKRERN